MGASIRGLSFVLSDEGNLDGFCNIAGRSPTPPTGFPTYLKLLTFKDLVLQKGPSSRS